MTAAVALTVAAVYFLFVHYVPWCNDDWNFREMYLRVSGGEFRLTSGWLADFIRLARVENDGRLSNVADLLFQFAPRTVYDVFFALMCVVWIMLGARISTGRGRPCASAALALWAMAILLLPWRDWIMGSVDYSLNYVVSSGVAVLFMWVWLRRISPAAILPAALVGFLAGCWHEGFSVPLACGAVLLCLSRRRWPDASHAVVLAALLAGIVTAMTAPRLLERVEGEGGGLVVVSAGYVLRDLPAVFILAAVCLAAMSRARWRSLLARAWRDTPLPLFIGACAMAVAIVLGKGLTPRVSWAAECFAMFALLALFRGPLSRVGAPAAVAAYTAIVIFYAGVICFQRQTARDIADVLELYGRSADGTVYFDYSTDVPMWTLHHPSRSQLTAPATVGFLRSLDPQRRTLRIEPAAADPRQPDDGD